MRNPNIESKAILHGGLLTSDQGHIGQMTMAQWGGHGEYHCHKGRQTDEFTIKIKSGLVDSDKLWSIPTREVDQIVLDRLCDLAKHDSDLSARVKAFFEGLDSTEMDEIKLLDQQIKQTQQRIERLDYLLKNPSIPLDDKTAREYAIELGELRQKLSDLIKKQQDRPQIDPEQTIKNFYFILAHLPTEFRKQGIDVQRLMMRKLIKQITIDNLSLHLYRLYIIWQDGIATRPDVALLWRGIGRRNTEGWSDEEDAIIRMYYTTGPQLEIMRRLPSHSWNMIRDRARLLPDAVRRERHGGSNKVNEYGETVSYSDIEAAMQFAESEEDATYLSKKVKELSENTFKGKMSAYWPLPLDIVGFSSVIIDHADMPRQD